MTFTIFDKEHKPIAYLIGSNVLEAQNLVELYDGLSYPGHYWVEGYIITE